MGLINSILDFLNQRASRQMPLIQTDRIAAPGLQCGFGELLGSNVLNAVRERGFKVVRIDCQDKTPERTYQLATEVVEHHLQPLVIFNRPEQLLHLPEGSLAELGNEPDIEANGWTVAQYIDTARKSIPIARNLDIRLYLGAISNLNKRGFAFLTQLPWAEWRNDIGCSVHRYPNGNSPLVAQHGFGSREDEMRYLRSIIDIYRKPNRPLAVTEVGYNNVGFSLSDAANHMAWERQFFGRCDVELVIGYQLNDDAKNSQFGFSYFRSDLINDPVDWKPAAETFTQLKGTNGK